MNNRSPANIRLVAFDIDGVFTDGRFYLSDDGIESKAFHTQDGYGIRRLLDAGVVVAVISGRNSGAVQKRMSELGVQHIVLGCSDKVIALDAIAAGEGVAIGDCAYVGDDIPDLPLLRHVGYAIAVSNSVPALFDECDYTTRASGGFGAVREVCELILGNAGQQETGSK